MTVRKPNSIDVHVGSRVRLKRMMSGMSQEKLGETLGITFQQVQKYEKGTNRIGASRLQAIAGALQTPISFFFEDAPVAPPVGGAEGLAESADVSYVVDFLSTSEGLALNRAFLQIKDPTVRKQIIELVKTLAGGPNSEAEADDATEENPTDPS